jgi:hypothetical protein
MVLPDLGILTVIMPLAWPLRSKDGFGTSSPRFNHEKASPVSIESSSVRQISKNLLKKISFLQIIDMPLPSKLVLKEEASHAGPLASIGR